MARTSRSEPSGGSTRLPPKRAVWRRLTPAKPEDGGARGVRLFLALDVPDEARREIARWRDSVVGERKELRPVAAGALHVTLVFLGRRPQDRIAEIWELASAAAGGLGVPTLTPATLVPVPARRPRLLALDLSDEGARAAAVHGALSRALEGAGLHEPEARPFWPHVTLARVRGRSRLAELKAPPPPPRAAFRAPALTLYRSDLHPAGARYVALERLDLARPTG